MGLLAPYTQAALHTQAALSIHSSRLPYTPTFLIHSHYSYRPRTRRDQRGVCGRPTPAPSARQPVCGFCVCPCSWATSLRDQCGFAVGYTSRSGSRHISINSQKTAKPAIPHLAGHALQPMPGRFPHASDPHASHVPMQPMSPCNPCPHATTAWPCARRDQRPVPANQAPAKSRKSTCGGGGGARKQASRARAPSVTAMDARRFNTLASTDPPRPAFRFTQIRIRPAYTNSLQRRAARRRRQRTAPPRGDGDVDDRGAGMSWSGLGPDRTTSPLQAGL